MVVIGRSRDFRLQLAQVYLEIKISILHNIHLFTGVNIAAESETNGICLNNAVFYMFISR